jgi:predicted RNA-binding protein with PUA-like domain
MRKVADYLPSRHWLIKSEPSVFSFSDLLLAQGQQTFWEGVRNYQARNFMVNDMQLGDKALFYHSNSNPPGIAGVVEIVGAAEVDKTAFDPTNQYFDAKSTVVKPRWYGVMVGRPKEFKHFLSLDRLRQTAELSEMLVLRRGQRLSVQPVAPEEFRIIVSMGSK